MSEKKMYVRAANASGDNRVVFYDPATGALVTNGEMIQHVADTAAVRRLISQGVLKASTAAAFKAQAKAIAEGNEPEPESEPEGDPVDDDDEGDPVDDAEQHTEGEGGK